MITQNINHFNENNNNIQENYDKEIDSLQIHMIKCACNVHGECIKYGKYKRTFKVNGRKLIIYIQRIYCKHCGKTHAVIPSFLVPYKTKPLRELIEDFEIYLSCDEENISFTNEEKRNNTNFKNWKERLISMSIKLTNIIDEIKEIIVFCAKYFSMCIFQNTRRKYINKTKLYYVYYIPLGIPTYFVSFSSFNSI